MFKLVTCPEFGGPARVDVAVRQRSGRDQVLYCSLWASEEVIESCRETCVLACDPRFDQSKPDR